MTETEDRLEELEEERQSTFNTEEALRESLAEVERLKKLVKAQTEPQDLDVEAKIKRVEKLVGEVDRNKITENMRQLIEALPIRADQDDYEVRAVYDRAPLAFPRTGKGIVEAHGGVVEMLGRLPSMEPTPEQVKEIHERREAEAYGPDGRRKG